VSTEDENSVGERSMTNRVRRRLMGAIFLGMGANFAHGFSNYDQNGAHLGAGALIGLLVAVGAYYLTSANEPQN
jgi:hypothetical protein